MGGHGEAPGWRKGEGRPQVVEAVTQAAGDQEEEVCQGLVSVLLCMHVPDRFVHALTPTFLVCRAARKATVERAKKDKLKRREENLKSRGKGARKGGKQVGWHGQAWVICGGSLVATCVWQRAGFEGARNQFLNKK